MRKIFAGDSHCFWFFSALLVQLQDLSRLVLTGVSGALCVSGCSDFGHGFYV